MDIIWILSVVTGVLVAEMLKELLSSKVGKRMKQIFAKWTIFGNKIDSVKAVECLHDCSKTSKSNVLSNSSTLKHIAVIMDGNRRYGVAVHGDPLEGHIAGARTLVDFIKWCIEDNIEILTVFAFSTENWKRSQNEIDLLIDSFTRICDDILKENNNVRIKGIMTSPQKFPQHVMEAIEKAENETAHCNGLQLNVCLSYGSREELVIACTAIASKVCKGDISLENIDEDTIKSHLLTRDISDPDILIRTSGEHRISNFLLYQLAYTEMFFLDKTWPEIQHDDLKSVISQYFSRHRRFGR